MMQGYIGIIEGYRGIAWGSVGVYRDYVDRDITTFQIVPPMFAVIVLSAVMESPDARSP